MNFIGDPETDLMTFRASLPVATIILMMFLTPLLRVPRQLREHIRFFRKSSFRRTIAN